jgi:hypothetical protein
MTTLPSQAEQSRSPIDLYMRGEIPPALSGSLVIACSRRNKDRRFFSRWHDSQTDLIRLDLYPGRPGRVRAHILAVNPSGSNLNGGFKRSSFDRRSYAKLPAYGFATQPNHGINIAGNNLWATNLLFGAPLEVDFTTFRPRRILRYVEPHEMAPRVSSTAHFAWSLDRRYAYFHQSLLESETVDSPVRTADLKLIELDVNSGSERTWSLLPPVDDDAPESANFHSAFYFEEKGKRYVGLLKTGAIVEHIAPHVKPKDHPVIPMQPSTIWLIEVDHDKNTLQAELLAGIRELGSLALSHLDVDASSGDGFILYANFKQADVAEETHGHNIYGESPEQVTEHYSGMIVEALNFGLVIRYERRNGKTKIKRFSRRYDYGRTSLGHSWLPINIELNQSKTRLFCTFSGFHPRLLSQHVAGAYKERVVNPDTARYVPPLLMRFDSVSLEPEYDSERTYLSYAEPIAMTVVGDGTRDYVCTFAPEVGLRIYAADHLNHMVGYAVSAELMNWKDSHFRPDPAHMQFIYR